MSAVAEKTWTKTDREPYYLAPNEKHIRHLKVVEEFVGKFTQAAYSDQTKYMLKLRWVHQTTGQERPFEWEKCPKEVADAVYRAVCVKRNPWIGCYYSDDFDGAEGDTVYKTVVIPIGD